MVLLIGYVLKLKPRLAHVNHFLQQLPHLWRLAFLTPRLIILPIVQPPRNNEGAADTGHTVSSGVPVMFCSRPGSIIIITSINIKVWRTFRFLNLRRVGIITFRVNIRNEG
jgi:hypothetical protein